MAKSSSRMKGRSSSLGKKNGHNTAPQDASREGTKLPGKIYSTSVYVKQGGEWLSADSKVFSSQPPALIWAAMASRPTAVPAPATTWT